MMVSLRAWLYFCCLIFVFIGLATRIPVAQAADPLCNCFCTDPRGGGARDVGGKKDFAECDTFCKSQDSKLVVCASTFAQLPGNSLRCFTPEQCIEQGGQLDTDQAPECPTGMSHCLPGDTSIDLIVDVPVGEGPGLVGNVTNIGNYINVMYRYLLWVGVAVAVVMLMVGGLQYVLYSGSADVQKARTRMVQAVIGLVLLMGAFVILLTVNPNLVKLSLPKLPMVKRLGTADHICEKLLENLPDGSESRAELQGLGGEVVTRGICGDEVKVVKTQMGDQAVAGLTCGFVSGCESGKMCIGKGAAARCASCEDMVKKEGDTADALASSSACRQLSGPIQRSGSNLLSQNICFFTKDADVTVTTNVGVCAELELDCEEIDECEDYEDLDVHNVEKSDDLEDINGRGITDVSLKTICESNPCFWHIQESDPEIVDCYWSAPPSAAVLGDTCESISAES